MGNKLHIAKQLELLGLGRQEAIIFLALVDGPKTYSGVNKVTGVSRSSLYRLIPAMHAKGLVREYAADDGKLLAAADPAALETLVVETEKAAESQRQRFGQLLPLLQGMSGMGDDFAVQTYSGIGGLKQMLWNELKTKGEILIFSSGSINPATGKRWAEKYRAEIIDRGIVQRSLENSKTVEKWSSIDRYSRHYLPRYLPDSVLHIEPEITIHGNTVSIYNSWGHEIRLGTEIHNPFLAAFMRQIFEHYWSIATVAPKN